MALTTRSSPIQSNNGLAVANLALTIPSDIQTGDLLIVVAMNKGDASNNVVVSPTGSTWSRLITKTPDSSHQYIIDYRTANSSDAGATYTWFFGPGSGYNNGGSAYLIAVCDTAGASVALDAATPTYTAS